MWGFFSAEEGQLVPIGKSSQELFTSVALWRAGLEG